MAPLLSTINLGVGLRDGQLHSLEDPALLFSKSSKYFLSRDFRLAGDILRVRRRKKFPGAEKKRFCENSFD